MDYGLPDFLRPIGEDNRDEMILVQFHRVFKNTNMSLLRNLIKESAKDKEMLMMLPAIPTFAALSPDQMYDAAVLYNRPEDLIYVLSKEKLSMDTCRKLASSFMEPLDLDLLHKTRLEMVLQSLMSRDFVKKLYFIADTITTEMKAYIASSFKGEDVSSRVRFIEGNLLDSLSQIQGITTCFINSSAEFFQVTGFDDQLVDGKMFIISDGYNDIEISEEGKENDFTYKGLKEFSKYGEDKRASIGYMYPYSIPHEI